jgi:hypothetical protein
MKSDISMISVAMKFLSFKNPKNVRLTVQIIDKETDNAS